MKNIKFIKQVKTARAILGWSQSELAKRCKVSTATINRIENLAGDPFLNTLASIQNYLQLAGIEFVGDTGVRLHEPLAAGKLLAIEPCDKLPMGWRCTFKEVGLKND